MANTNSLSQPVPQEGAVRFTMLLAGLVLLLMMVIGFAMRAAQANMIALDPALFYQLLTVHGAGMVGTAGLTGAAIMWYFVGRHVRLAGGVFWAFLALFLLGVVLILGAVFLGGFGGAWTFLFPLPANSGGAWSVHAAATFLLGYVSIGVAFLLLYLEVGRKLIGAYGGIGGALGWPYGFGSGSAADAPPPTVVAAMATTVFNTIGTVVGAAVLASCIVNLYFPDFKVDALLAKNMTFFFGHVFINASIYMAVIAVYEILPEYTGTPWKTSRLFVIAWSAVMLFVMAVYPHHLLQDTAMPGWALVLGQVISYLSGIPLLAVTAFSLIVYLRKADRLRWDMASALLVLGVAGWSVGSVPAIIDGMISVNKVMHNTMWVPGHFHIYLILGEVAMSFGFMMWLAGRRQRLALTGTNYLAFTAYLLGGAGFTVMFLLSGAASVPRRWAVHAPEWLQHDRIATGFAALVILGAAVFLARFIGGLNARTR